MYKLLHHNQVPGLNFLILRVKLFRISLDKRILFYTFVKIFTMKKFLIAFTVIVLAAGCSSGDSNETVTDGSYDRKALLMNWADNIIIPAFTNYQAKVNVLSEKTATYTATPTTDNLIALRASWLAAYKAYQYVGIHDIGKASELYLIESTNIYPTDAAGITANISSGTYVLTQPRQYARQGFPALDFLINGLGATDGEIVSYYTTNTNATGYKKYITDVTTQLKVVADAIVADWNGGYRNAYIENTSASITGAIGQTTNNYIKNCEKDVRFPKLGVPAGVFSNGTTYPDKVEAFYKKDVSKELLLDALKASQDFYNGRNFTTGAEGPSLKGFLDAVNAGGSTPLSGIINNKYNAALTATNALNNNLTQQITTDNAAAVNAYNAIQQIVIYTKVDLLNALHINIDYVDADGD